MTRKPMNARFFYASGLYLFGRWVRAGTQLLLIAPVACAMSAELDFVPPRAPQIPLFSGPQVRLPWSVVGGKGIVGYRVYREDRPSAQVRASNFYGYRLKSQRRSTVRAYGLAAPLLPPSTALELTAPPLDPRCAEDGFSFLVFSDTYEGEEAGLERVLAWARPRLGELRFVVSAGDTPPWHRIRTLLDQHFVPGDFALCGAHALPWFPTAGNHDLESPSAMQRWAAHWVTVTPYRAGTRDEGPAADPFARQLPGVVRFVRGPRVVWAIDPTGEEVLRQLPAGTIYGFDYRGVRFVFLDTYEQGYYEDSYAGVWDRHGEYHDAARSQLDWLEQTLIRSPRPRAVFVFGHVALRAPCYNSSPPDPRWPCDGPSPPGWSEHNSRFHTDALLERLTAHRVTAYFHGHDHVPSRMLLAADGTVLEDWRFWQTARRYPPPPRMPSAVPPVPRALWQVDAGRVARAQGSFVHVRVRTHRVDFELYRYSAPDYAFATDPIPRGQLVLWDRWAIALDQDAEALLRTERR